MLLVAPDSFKGTYSAREVAQAIARGFPGEVDQCPTADGGEGTLEIVVGARGGETIDVQAHDPLGRSITAPVGWIDGRSTAVVETALVSGLGLVAEPERDAEAASTFGTGELIVAAARAGARHIVVPVGGSASTDGGSGAISAIDAGGGVGGARLTVLCDVTTPFERAAELYARQKGASSAAIVRLNERLNMCARSLPRDPRRVAMTGAAGGLSGALWAMYDAVLVPGASWVLDALDFDARLDRATAVVTGEGCLDRQTFEGKLVGEVTMRCQRAGKPVHAVVGSTRLTDAEARAFGLASVGVASGLAAMEAAGAAVAQRA